MGMHKIPVDLPSRRLGKQPGREVWVTQQLGK